MPSKRATKSLIDGALTLNSLVAAGVAAAGPVTLAGAKVGDRLIAAIGSTTGGGTLVAAIPGTDFEQIVSVADQIQQLTATDLSGKTFVFQLQPAKTTIRRP
jgi:hypothetical protein